VGRKPTTSLARETEKSKKEEKPKKAGNRKASKKTGGKTGTERNKSQAFISHVRKQKGTQRIVERYTGGVGKPGKRKEREKHTTRGKKSKGKATCSKDHKTTEIAKERRTRKREALKLTVFPHREKEGVEKKQLNGGLPP